MSLLSTHQYGIMIKQKNTPTMKRHTMKVRNNEDLANSTF